MKLKKAMKDKKIHVIWYRVVLKDGSCWMETRDVREAERELAQLDDASIWVLRSWIVTDRWRKFMS